MSNVLATIPVLLLIALCTWSHSAHATSVTEFTFTDLVAQADVIAVGTVTSISEQWDAEKKAPLTLVTFSNLTAVKGSPGSSFTLEFLGGTMPNGLVMMIPGVPQFTVGEKAVVFSHTTTDINCKSCGELLAEKSGSLAIINGKVLGALDQ